MFYHATFAVHHSLNAMENVFPTELSAALNHSDKNAMDNVLLMTMFAVKNQKSDSSLKTEYPTALTHALKSYLTHQPKDAETDLAKSAAMVKISAQS